MRSPNADLHAAPTLIALRAFDSAKGSYYYAYFRDPSTEEVRGFRVDPAWVDLDSEAVRSALARPFEEWPHD